MERATQERLVGATLLIVAGVILIPWLLDGSMTEPGVNEQELVLPGGRDSGNETRRISLEVPRQGVAGSVNGGSTTAMPATPGSSQSVSINEVDARSVKGVDDPKAVKLPKPEPRQASAAEVPARFSTPMPKSGLPTAQVTPNSRVVAKSDPPAPVPKPVKREVASTTPAVRPAAVVKTPEAPAGKSAWAVQVGSFASEENAERLAARLRDKSYQAFVMRNVIDGLVRFRVRVGPVSERNQAELLATALREDRQPARILSHP